MNKEEIQNKIEQLEKELNELKKKITEPERWKPYEFGVPLIGANFLNPHNIFRTRELAELRAKQREAEDELFNIWEHLVGNWRPNNKDQIWHVVWDNYKNVTLSFADSERGEITIYKLFPTSELAIKQYELASDHARAYIRGEF
jgi:hypothetical protein